MDGYKKFEKEGYLVLRDVIDQNSIKKLKTELNSEFEANNNPGILNFYELEKKNKILNDILLNTKLLSSIEQIFKDCKKEGITLYPPFQIMRNFFQRYSRHTWHIDASGEFRYKYCKERLRNNLYLFGKVGIFLQNNTQFGGQIDLIPRSHNLYKNISILNFLKKNLLKIKMRFIKNMNIDNKIKFEKFFLNYKRLELNLGDIVLFDSRIFHRSTPMDKNSEKDIKFSNNSNYVKDLSIEKSKYAIYFQFGNNTGLESYWYDRSKRETSKYEIEQWKKTINDIEDFYKKKAVQIPKLIDISIDKIFKF